MTPGSHSALYVAGGSVVTILAVALGVRAVSPPPPRSAAASAQSPFTSLNGPGAQQGLPAGASSAAAAGYRVEQAVPIELGGQPGIAVRFSGQGLDAAGKQMAARDIFRRMKDDAESAGAQVLVISYGEELPAPGDKPSAEDNFIFMRQPDGTWARLRTDAPPDESASAAPPAGSVPLHRVVPAPK